VRLYYRPDRPDPILPDPSRKIGGAHSIAAAKCQQMIVQFLG
jgi:hypothetical protein